MQAKNLISLRGTSLIAGVLLAITGAHGAPLPADAFPTFDSYIKISGQSARIDGNEAAFQKRTNLSKSDGVGIEELHFSKDYDKGVALTIDGRALTGSEDYLGKFLLSKNEVGSFEVGYKSFRTFYDNIGGFFPISKQWNALSPEALHIDRGEFWAAAKIARPGMPEFEIKFADGFRKGKKDTTVWGDSDLTGLPLALAPNPVSDVRKMVPSYRNIDEHHQNLEGSMKATFGKTSVNLTAVHEKTNDIDTRFGTRFPGEVIPWSIASLSSTANAATGISPQNAAKALLTPNNWNNQVTYAQTDGMKTKLDGITAKASTEITDKVTVEAGLNYQKLTSDFTGDRPLFTSTPTAVGVVIVGTNNYLNLAGGSDVKIYTGNIGLDFKPTKDALIKLSFRGEDKYTKSAGTLTAVTAATNTTTGVVTTTNNDQIFNSRVKEKSSTPALDLRYSGIKDLALYASGSVRKVDGDERYVTPYNPITTPSPANGNLAYNSTNEDRKRFTVGFNWHASSAVTVRGEIFHKENTNQYGGYIKRADGFVDTYDLGYKYDGFKATAIVKPHSTLSLTGRYVYQKGKATVTSTAVTGSASAGYAATYPEYNSMDMENHMIGGTLDWTPSKQFYSQANLNLVFNKINTIYPRAGTTPEVKNSAGTTTARAWDTNNVLHNSNNNYITASLLAGMVLTKTDDVQIQYTYYKADNYDPELAAYTMPYGAGAKESVISVAVKHKFSDRVMGNAKLGYYDAKNDTTGGFTNFRGPVAYVSLDFAL